MYVTIVLLHKKTVQECNISIISTLSSTLKSFKTPFHSYTASLKMIPISISPEFNGFNESKI